MFIYTNNKMLTSHEIFIEDTNQQQIIFATLENKSLFNWLQNILKIPSQVFEDIEDENQSISYEEYANIKIFISKFVSLNQDETLFYRKFNISILNVKNILLVICKNKNILTELSQRFEKRYKKSDSTEYAIYVVLDILVDNLIARIDTIDSILEKFENDILEERVLEKKLQKDIYFIRRILHKITKLSLQEADSVNKFYNNLLEKEKKELEYEFIDIKEHINFLVLESKELLDRTGYLLNLHMGIMSNKMNQAMQKLASISLIFLPLTFIVGNYGMNFTTMPEIDTQYGYYTITFLNITIAGAIYWWLKRKKWI